jgi:adenylylsulfate kinase-like enzyme
MYKSRVFWITGLSGSGKTTLAENLLTKLNSKEKPTVLIDGDVIREIFENSSDYSRESRLKTAYQYSKLALFLAKNNINVICSTISLFHEVQEWNRKNITGYFEIFLDVEMEEILRRDSKNIYSRAQKGELKNVVGIDIKAEFPKNPEMILHNMKQQEIDNYVNKIITASLEKKES